jgi:hypothetical protein
MAQFSLLDGNAARRSGSVALWRSRFEARHRFDFAEHRFGTRNRAQDLRLDSRNSSPPLGCRSSSRASDPTSFRRYLVHLLNTARQADDRFMVAKARCGAPTQRPRFERYLVQMFEGARSPAPQVLLRTTHFHRVGAIGRRESKRAGGILWNVGPNDRAELRAIHSQRLPRTSNRCPPAGHREGFFCS